MDDNIFLFSRVRNHVLKKIRVGRECTVPSPLRNPMAQKRLDDRMVDGCSILLETQLVVIHLPMDTTQVISVGGSLRLWELPERGQILTSNRL